jgi:hypothetical protein
VAIKWIERHRGVEVAAATGVEVAAGLVASLARDAGGVEVAAGWRLR